MMRQMNTSNRTTSKRRSPDPLQCCLHEHSPSQVSPSSRSLRTPLSTPHPPAPHRLRSHQHRISPLPHPNPFTVTSPDSPNCSGSPCLYLAGLGSLPGVRSNTIPGGSNSLSPSVSIPLSRAPPPTLVPLSLRRLSDSTSPSPLPSPFDMSVVAVMMPSFRAGRDDEVRARESRDSVRAG
jgi:hypothetical protein